MSDTKSAEPAREPLNQMATVTGTRDGRSKPGAMCSRSRYRRSRASVSGEEQAGYAERVRREVAAMASEQPGRNSRWRSSL